MAGVPTSYRGYKIDAAFSPSDFKINLILGFARNQREQMENPACC